MPAIVTDQFRILNANNFVESVENTNNSYYVFIGLSNPTGAPTLAGYGRTSDWNSSDKTPAPTDSFSYRAHSGGAANKSPINNAIAAVGTPTRNTIVLQSSEKPFPNNSLNVL